MSDDFTAGRQVGYRDAVEDFLKSVRCHGPERTAIELALAVQRGLVFAPRAKDDARWVLDNIQLSQPQESGL